MDQEGVRVTCTPGIQTWQTSLPLQWHASNWYWCSTCAVHVEHVNSNAAFYVCYFQETFKSLTSSCFWHSYHTPEKWKMLCKVGSTSNIFRERERHIPLPHSEVDESWMPFIWPRTEIAKMLGDGRPSPHRRQLHNTEHSGSNAHHVLHPPGACAWPSCDTMYHH